MNRNIIIIGEHHEGTISPGTLELLDFSRALGSPFPEIILLGSDIFSLAENLAERTGCAVTLINGEHLNLYSAELYQKALLEVLRPRDERTLCIAFSHTSLGFDLAPALAHALQAPCISSVEDIEESSFVRSIFGGKLQSVVTPQNGPVVLTVLPGAFSPDRTPPEKSGHMRIVDVSVAPVSMIPQGERASEYRDSGLHDADVIVSAGRGIGKKENLSLISALASLFPRSALGASRAVCDLGWMEYRHQIGTTGQTVSPKLYIACGISGAIQHTSGMKNAQTIIAINSDPNAAIFSVSHYAIVEDLLSFIPVLMEEYTHPPG